MSRPLRISFPGAFYHVTSRGNERKEIFRGPEDYERFNYYVSTASYEYDGVGNKTKETDPVKREKGRVSTINK
jgi:hypothetical protein